jgi:hypothetical protein
MAFHRLVVVLPAKEELSDIIIATTRDPALRKGQAEIRVTVEIMAAILVSGD